MGSTFKGCDDAFAADVEADAASSAALTGGEFALVASGNAIGACDESKPDTSIQA